MTKYPIVLIVSEGQTTPSEIISNIRKLPSEEDVESLGFFPTISDSINGHIFHLKTKYYTTDLYLVPFQEDISRFPLELQEDIEGVLIYFDSGVRSFSKRIPIYANYLNLTILKWEFCSVIICMKILMRGSHTRRRSRKVDS
uniref:Uncharacterized protein n=1 Tax=Megaselia scalaris TaxID=36166 RepID=T1H3N2_MEGSC